MKKYKTIIEAQRDAEKFFSETFGYNDGIGIESANGKQVEFYSKNDPGMEDTFTCEIEDGYNRYCKNGEKLRIIKAG